MVTLLEHWVDEDANANLEGFRFKVDKPTPCAGDPEAFFAESAEEAKAAVRACSYCPFQNECRLEGLERNEMGIWGGLSYNARVRMGAKRRAIEIRRLRFLIEAEKLKKGKAS